MSMYETNWSSFVQNFFEENNAQQFFDSISSRLAYTNYNGAGSISMHPENKKLPSETRHCHSGLSGVQNRFSEAIYKMVKMLTLMSTSTVWLLTEMDAVLCTIRVFSRKTGEANTSVEWSEIIVDLFAYRSAWNFVSHSNTFARSLAHSPTHSVAHSVHSINFNTYKCIIDYRFAVIARKSSQINLRSVNGVTCTTRIAGGC